MLSSGGEEVGQELGARQKGNTEDIGSGNQKTRAGQDHLICIVFEQETE